MAATSSWSRSAAEIESAPGKRAVLPGRSPSRLIVFVALDVVTVLVAMAFAASLEFRTSNPVAAAWRFWNASIRANGAVFGYILISLPVVFMAFLLLSSWRMHLYTPERLHGYLHEQRLTFETCLMSGLILNGTI